MSTQRPSVVFFVGDLDRRQSDYQLHQWLQPLQRLSKECTVHVLIPTSKNTQQFPGIPSLTLRQFSSVRECRNIIRELAPDVIFYPNRHPRNFIALFYSGAQHIFVSHGESEKAYMSRPGLAVFDVLFLAGEMAVDRVKKSLPRFPASRIRLIGRPQLLDEHPIPKSVPETLRPYSVLYAPTWEGGSPQSRYGSVVSHGEKLIESLLKSPQFRVIYRPHPLTGTLDAEWAERNQKIAELVKQAQHKDPQSGHFVDTTPFGWHLEAVDAMVSDISAVAYDWLSTGKPLIMTSPAEPAADLTFCGILQAVPTVRDHEASETAQSMLALLQSDTPLGGISWTSRYFSPVRDPETGREMFIEHTLSVAQAKKPGYARGKLRRRGIFRRIWFRVKLSTNLVQD